MNAAEDAVRSALKEGFAGWRATIRGAIGLDRDETTRFLKAPLIPIAIHEIRAPPRADAGSAKTSRANTAAASLSGVFVLVTPLTSPDPLAKN